MKKKKSVQGNIQPSPSIEMKGNDKLAQEILNEMFAQGILTEGEIIEVQFKQESLVYEVTDSMDENEA